MMLGVVVGLVAFLFLAVTGGYWLYGHAVPHCACVEMTKGDYQQRKRALEDGTVFIAILTGAGVIWWWVACFKR